MHNVPPGYKQKMSIAIDFPPKLPELSINIGLDLNSRREFYRYRSSGRTIETDESGYYFHQKIVQQFMMYADHLMLIHEAGSGKSKTALSVMQEIQRGGFLEHLYKKIVIATPNDELARAWTLNSEIANSDKRYFEVMTHYELSLKDPKDYPRTIFIIDEVHKLANESVLDKTREYTTNPNLKDMASKYGGIWNLLHRSKLAKVMLLTATPFQNDVADFYPLLNIILPENSQIDRRTSEAEIVKRMTGRVSFVRNVYQDIKIEYDLSSELYNKIQEFQLTGSRDIGNVLGYYGNSSIATLAYEPNNQFQTYRLPFFDVSEFKTTMFSLGSDQYVSLLFLVNEDRQVSFVKKVSLNELEEADITVDLVNAQFGQYASDQGSYIEFDLRCSNINEEFLFENKFYLTMAVPGLLRSSIPFADNRRYGVVRSILGAAHTGYLRDVERSAKISSDGQVEVDDRAPDRRLIFSDEQQSFVFRDIAVEDLTADVNTFSSCSKIYYHMILFLLSTATKENRTILLANNPHYRDILSGDPIEPGKSLFYSRYITKEYGIGFLADLLTRFGYERLTSDTNISTAKPRFAISPDSNKLRDLINHEDNWDGSRCQLVLFSQRGATGFSYFDIRHIHLVPGWSPSENTQAIFRGIRSGGHKNFVRKAGYIPTIRVCIHTISPHLGQGVTTPAFYGTEVTINDKKFVNSNSETSYRFGWRYGETGNFERVFDREVNNPMEFDKTISDVGTIEEENTANIYYTNLGLAMRNFPTMLRLENMTSPFNQLVDYNDMFKGLNSVLSYILFDSLNKDMEFANIRRKLKSYAVDCELLKIRNTLPDGFANTSECDYGSCTINCISESGQIPGNDVDLKDGSDPRRSRALSPLSVHRTTTHDHYLTISDTARKSLVAYIKEYMQENIRVNYYRLIKDIWEQFHDSTHYSEKHIEDCLLSMIYGKDQTLLRDKFDRVGRLSYMGELVYVVPLEVGPEFIHERYREVQYSGKYLQSDYMSIYQTGISNEDVHGVPAKLDENTITNIFNKYQDIDIMDLMKTDFTGFVSFVEACYVGSKTMNNPRMTDIAKQFGMYFVNVPGKELQIYYRPGRDSKSNIRVYFMEEVREVPVEPTDEQVLVNFLWHIFPSTVTPRGFISDFSYVRIFAKQGYFVWANDGQRKSIIAYVKEKSKTAEQKYLLNTGGLFGYIDYRNKMLDSEKPDEYLMLVFKEPKEEVSAKALQGRACKSFNAQDYGKIGEKLGITFASKDSKSQKCSQIENSLREKNYLLDGLE